jgi:membrane protein implicated in regulation of membrane protease activity
MMKSHSASALIWFSLILLILGGLMMSPTGSLFVFALAGLFAAIPVIFSFFVSPSIDGAKQQIEA